MSPEVDNVVKENSSYEDFDIYDRLTDENLPAYLKRGKELKLIYKDIYIKHELARKHTLINGVSYHEIKYHLKDVKLEYQEARSRGQRFSLDLEDVDARRIGFSLARPFIRVVDGLEDVISYNVLPRSYMVCTPEFRNEGMSLTGHETISTSGWSSRGVRGGERAIVAGFCNPKVY